jgi:signal transduction histidine kinase/DNA-binding response OmpR family regulator
MKRRWQTFSAWLRNIPVKDPVEKKQAYLLQTMMIWLCFITLLTLPSSFFIFPTITGAIRSSLSSIFILIFYIISLYVLRQGIFRRSVLIAATGLLVGLTSILVIEGLRNSGWVLSAFMMPITLAGLLTGRRGILIVGALSIAAITIVGILQLTTTGLVGAFPREGDLLPPTISTFVLSTLVVMFFFHRFSASLRDALTRTQHALATSEVLVVERTRALSDRTEALEEVQKIRDHLEILVKDRTAALEDALHTVEDREANLAQTNVALAAAKTAAEEANQLKSRFLANMSHELRTPLNAIINFTAFIERYGDFSDRQRDLQQRVLYNADHLLGLINDILDLSKIEAGRMELLYEATELQPLIEGVMTTAMGLTRDKGLELNQDIPDELPIMVIDKVRIRQVLLNLLSNAVKFTEEGSITLAITQPDAKTIRVAVTDSGVGISPENQQRIFEEFQQIQNDAMPQQQGTGLGLPISKRLVEMHGGQMWMESVLGQGSTFYFTLPINAGSPEPPAEQPALVLNTQPSGTGAVDIFVIDDIEDSHETFRMMLEPAGYRVTGVTDSRQAIAAIKQCSPRLIISDVQMPHLDGWELLAQIKNDPAIAYIPVIICSVVDQGTIGLVLGARKHIVKPIREETLLAVVRECVESTAHVLVVDDNADARQVMRGILAAIGYNLGEASNGVEAMAAIAANKPDLIILDLMMPEMDGFEVLRLLRGNEAYATIPVIIVSAKDLDAQEHEWLMGRAQGVIAKRQLSEAEFLQHIQRVFKQGA